MIIVVMGVSGSGKTTVGREAAERLGWHFCDADDLHDDDAVARIRAGEPLDDEARAPWLGRVRGAIDAALESGQPTVIACSALKEQYRRVLADGTDAVRFVYLDADPEVLRRRLVQRAGHFAGPGILESQLATLERPAYGLHLDAGRPVDELASAIAAFAGAPSGGGRGGSVGPDAKN